MERVASADFASYAGGNDGSGGLVAALILGDNIAVRSSLIGGTPREPMILRKLPMSLRFDCLSV